MRLSALAFVIISFVIANGSIAQSVKDQAGFTQLETRLGTALPDGAGLTASIVEAPIGANGGYLPDATSSQFTGKTIVDGSGLSSTPSSHATAVGWRFFGNSISMAGGIDDITGYEANDFLIRVLGAGTGTDPLSDSFNITSHSYIGNGVTAADQFAFLSRFDFVINRDNTVAVVGANNGSANATPDLLAPAYNAITVGRADGNHSLTLTSGYGAARTKPDIVVPTDPVATQNNTSNATPWVSSAAGLLLDAAQGTNGAQNEAVKAMLFAGATKEEFPDWDRTSTRPIDETFGFGELNIYNSYKIFEGGEFDGQTSDPSTNVGAFGYDFATFDGNNDLFYDFEVTEESVISAALTWNAEITDNDASNAFAPTLSVADLDLRLYDSSGGFLGLLVDESISTDYNHEHIYSENLAPGQYTLRISGDSAVDFGFAWRMQQVGTVAPVVNVVEMNSGESQRSAVESVSITFEDGDIILAADAVSVVQRSTQTEETFEAVEASVSRQFDGTQTVVTIQFDSHVRNPDNALVDGNYQITLSRNLVLKNGVPMSEDFVYGNQEAHGFYSFYGDAVGGNRSVDIFDLLAFRQGYRTVSGAPGYEFYLDFQADGSINIFDLLAFRSRFRTTLPFSFDSSDGISSSRIAGPSGASTLLQLRSSLQTERRTRQVQRQIAIPTVDLEAALKEASK